MNLDLKQIILQLVHEIIEGSDIYFVELEIRGRAGATQVIEIYLDKDDGIDVEECAMVSRKLGDELEAKDLVKGKYFLNVSSPDLSRPLILHRQYAKNVGRMLEVQFTENEASSKIKGILAEVTPQNLILEIPSKDKKAPKEHTTIPFSTLMQGKIVLPW